MSIKAPTNEEENGVNQSTYFTRLNLSFSISNSKKHGQKGKIAQQYMRRNSGHITPNNVGSIELMAPSKIAFHTQSHTQNKSVNLPKKPREQGCFTADRRDQQNEAEYIARPFPKRRQKSGQHQLIKLLFKYSNNLTGRITNNEQRSHRSPLLYDPEPARQGFKPNLKNKTRMNWVKDRYCVNRDKDHGLIDEEQGYSTRNITSYENSWLLRSSFRHKKIA